mgnify:FL=1
MHLLDKLVFQTPESLVTFYLSKGGNDLPHFMHMDKERMKDIFEHLHGLVQTENFKNKIELAIRLINK